MSTADTPDLQLRTGAGSAADCAAIAGLWRRAWISAHAGSAFVEPIEHWLARVKTEFGPPGEVLRLERDEQLLGFVVLHPIRRYLAQLYVDTHLQGHGFGKMLMDEARARMPGGFRLHVATVNVRGQRFYEREGMLRGAVDRHPVTGRERVTYWWRHEGR